MTSDGSTMNAGHDPMLPYDTDVGADRAVEAFIVGLARKTELEQGSVPVVDEDGGWFPTPTEAGTTGELITRPHLSDDRVMTLAHRRPAWLTVTAPSAPRALHLDGFVIDGCAPIMVRPTADLPRGTADPARRIVAYRGGDHLAPLAPVAAWPTERYRTDTDRITTLVVERGDEVVGSAQLVESTPGFGYLADLFVHPDHRGHGHASALLTARVALARDRGMTTVVLSASDVGRPVFVANGFAVAAWYTVYRSVSGER